MTAAIEVRDEVTKLTPYAHCMKVWASWLTLRDRQHGGGFSHPQDAKEFMRTGEAVEAAVNDLPRIQWWALRKAAGVSPAAWRFPDVPMIDALEQAEITLTVKLRNNRDTMRYFVE